MLTKKPMKKNLLLFFLLACCSASQKPEIQMSSSLAILHRTFSHAAVPAEDWSDFFQKGIDSCIQHNIPVYFIPAGRYICK